MAPAKTAAPPPRTRRTADERREEILQAAVAEFAAGGLHGTSTETIAARAGISQPYLFRLFRTKKELFIAAFTRCCATTQAAFEDAVAALPESASTDEKLAAMGEAYTDLIANPELLRVQMQGFTASAGDAEVGAAGRAGFARLFRRVEELTGADDEQLIAFFAQGMLLSVSSSLGHRTKDHDAKSWAAALREGE